MPSGYSYETIPFILVAEFSHLGKRHKYVDDMKIGIWLAGCLLAGYNILEAWVRSAAPHC
jgi:hypothetical protein